MQLQKVEVESPADMVSTIDYTPCKMQSRSKEGTNTSRPCRNKSKNGCKTCKIRKVRCDQDYPACRRCVSTGRVCDGYGIWGGGGNTYQQRYCPREPDGNALTEYAKPTLTCLKTFPVYPASALDTDEKYHFEWFWRRTARKLSGAFFSDSGNAPLFQASTSDLAVTHAILAVCSAHRHSDIPVGPSMQTTLRRDEGFALRQYNKAIKYLQRHLVADDSTSLRIALFSCITFIWLEFFRSHYQTARSHLEHGLKMLEYGHTLSSSNIVGGNLIDTWTLRTLKKLYVQVTLFGQRPRHPWPFVDNLKPIPRVATFSSAHEAREYLENLLVKICEVTENQPQDCSAQAAEARPMEQLSKEIKRDLDFWTLAYDKTFTLHKTTMDPVEAFAYRVLWMYHTMARIMADTMCETEESRFDRHTPNFLSMIEQALYMRRIALMSMIRERYFGPEDGLPHSIGDMGPIPPLYYLAVKCRVHRLRIHAIRLLEETPRKEGIWDATVVANIARKMMTLEEAHFHEQDSLNDDFCLKDVPQRQVLLVSVPPESQRVKILDVLLPDCPWDPVMLKCIRQNSIKQFEIDAQPSVDTNSKREHS